MDSYYHNQSEPSNDNAEAVVEVSLGMPVKVYSSLLNLGQDWLSTYLIIRSLDLGGVGYVDTSWQELADLRGCHSTTIRRHYKAGYGIGFTNCIKRKGGGIRIFYTSLKKVCKHYNLKDLGGITYTYSSELNRSGARACATAIEAQYGQRQALYAARMAQPKGKKGKVLDARKYLVPPSDNSVGVRGPYLKLSNDYSCPGVSITTIADRSIKYCKETGHKRSISPRTIRNRLSNNWRKDRGLDLIQKKRVAKQLSNEEAFLIKEQSFSGFSVIGDRIIKCIGSKAYQLLTNVYDASYELMSCRFLRAKVSKYVLS